MADLTVAPAAPERGGQRAALPPAEERGTLQVRVRALERMAVRAAGQVAGTVSVSGGLTRLRGRDYPTAHVRVHGPRAYLELDVAATWPCPVTDLTRQVRDRVRSEVTRLSGMDVLSVDVELHIVDPATTEAPRRRRVQ